MTSQKPLLNKPFLSILSQHGNILYTSPNTPPFSTLSLLSVIHSSAKQEGYQIIAWDADVNSMSLSSSASSPPQGSILLGVLDLMGAVVVFSVGDATQEESQLQKEAFPMQLSTTAATSQGSTSASFAADDSSSSPESLYQTSDTLQLMITQAIRKLLTRLFETLLGPTKKWPQIPQIQLQRKLQLIGGPSQELLKAARQSAPCTRLQLLLNARCGMRRKLMFNASKWSGLSKNILPQKGVVEWALYNRNAYVCGTCKRRMVNMLYHYKGDDASGMDIPLFLRPHAKLNWNSNQEYQELVMTSAKVLFIKLINHAHLVLLCGELPSLSNAIKHITERARSWKYLESNFLRTDLTSIDLRKSLNLSSELLAMVYIDAEQSFYIFEDFVNSVEASGDTIGSYQEVLWEDVEHLCEMTDFLMECLNESTDEEDGISESVMEHESFHVVFIRSDDGNMWCGVYRKRGEELDLSESGLLRVSKSAMATIEENLIE